MMTVLSGNISGFLSIDNGYGSFKHGKIPGSDGWVQSGSRLKSNGRMQVGSPTLISLPCPCSSTYIAVIVLAAVFLLIAVRQLGGFTIRIWQIMLGGALAVLLTGRIAPSD